jgi:tRNA(fMet)-specific endonuclease VapC
MSGFLLDTDHYTLLEEGHLPLLRHLQAVQEGEISISVITVEEALRGRLALVSRASDGGTRIKAYRLLARTVEIIGHLNIVDFDDRAEEQYQLMRGSRIRVGTQDMRIASIALVNSLVVVTRNRRDFGRLPGLSIEDWSGV